MPSATWSRPGAVRGLVRGLMCGLIASTVSTGCGSRLRTVRAWGEVRWQGRPVNDGVIVFWPIDGTAGPSTGGPIVAGRYDIAAARGPRAGGAYRVEISATGAARRYSPNVSGGGDLVAVHEELLPARYQVDSELRAEVAANAADHRQDFVLE